MSKFEKEYNKRFKNQELENNGFDGEALWESISGDLDLAEEAIGRAEFTWVKYLALGVVVIGVVVYSSIILSKENFNHKSSMSNDATQDHQYSMNDEVVKNQPKEINAEVNENKNEGQFKTININVNKKPIALSERSGNNSKKHLNAEEHFSNSQDLLPNGNVDISNLVDLSSSNFADKSMYNVENVHTSELSLTEGERNEKISFLNELTSKGKSYHLKQYTSEIEQDLLLDMERIPGLKLHEFSVVPAGKISSRMHLEGQQLSDQEKVEGKNTAWNVGASMGANVVNFNYSSTDHRVLAELKNGSESMVIGTSFALLLDCRLESGLIMGGGVEYNQHWSKLRFMDEVETEEMIPEQVIKIWVDESSGDTLNQLIGTAVVASKTSYNVIHYNSYQRFSLPLSVGYVKVNGKWNYGLRTGIAFNFTKGQEGKTLNGAGLPTPFQADDPFAPFNNLNVGFLLNPTFGYALNDSWLLTIDPQWRWSQKREIAGTDLRVGITQMNLNLGLSYRLR